MATPLTVDDIAALIGRELTAAEETATALWIEFAEGEIEAYLGRPIKPTVFEDETQYAGADGTIYFKNTPVISVESVVVNGETQVADAFTLTSWGIENVFDVYWSYLPFNNTQFSPDDRYGGQFVISYTAGLDYPNAIKSLVAKAVVDRVRLTAQVNYQEAQNQAGVKQITAEDYTIIWQSNGNSGMTNSVVSMFGGAADFATIKRYKRIGVK